MQPDNSTQPSQPDNAGMLRTGIIGAGRMGITHLSILGWHPNVKLVSVADDSPIISKALAKYRPDVVLYKDYRKMLQKEPLNAVLIATPPNLHVPMIEAALEANLSIFVEKPFTLGSADATRLHAVSSLKRGAFQVGYVNRFNDVFMKVRKLLLEGLIGDLYSFRSDMFGGTVTRPGSDSGWRGKRENGGGCLYEFGSHAIDLMVYFFGRPAQVKGACLTSVYSKSVEDIVHATVIYPNGLVGSLLVNWSDTSYRKPTNKIEILGTEGKIVADQHTMKVFLHNAKDEYVKGWNTVYITSCFTPVPFYVRGNEFTHQLYSFVEAALNPEKKSISGFADAADTQAVIDMIFEDARVEN